MDRQQFEDIVEQAYNHLPPLFKEKIENVEIVVEDRPSSEDHRKGGVRSGALLLGLYHGVPLTHRGTWYGMTPVLPDRISIYKENIESVSRTDVDIRYRIYEVLCHEIGHYFGMNEDQIRHAMKEW